MVGCLLFLVFLLVIAVPGLLWLREIIPFWIFAIIALVAAAALFGDNGKR